MQGGDTFDTVNVQIERVERVHPISAPARPAELRPTLVIALGGIGRLTLTLLKVLYTRVHGSLDLPPWIRLLAFDSANEYIMADDVHLEPGGEFFYIGKVPVNRIKHNISRLDAIRERLGGAIEQLTATSLYRGAKQIRSLGLLALLWNFGMVEQKIKESLWSLAERSGASAANGINVVILNSLGGGQGSGIFLDIAMLVRDITDGMGELASFCQITGVGVLPKALVGIEGPNIIPNTVAAIKEIDRLMLGDGFTMTYPTGRVIESHAAPFDLYYLVDGIDERGLTWQGVEDVCQMIARGVFLQMGSQIGQKGENVLDNLDKVLMGVTEDGEGTFFGSMGVADLVWPASQVVAKLSWRLLEDTLSRRLLRPAQDEQAEEAEQALLRPLAPDAIKARMTRDEQGAPSSVVLDVPARLKQIPTGRKPAEARRYVREHHRLRVQGSMARTIEGHRQQLLLEIVNEIRAELERVARDPAGGLRTAALGVEKTRQEVRGRLELARAGRDEQSAALERLGQAAEDRALALEAAAGGGLFRGRNSERVMQAYFKAAEAQSRVHLALLVEEAHIALLAELDKRLAELDGQLSAVIADLGAIQARAAREAQSPLVPAREATIISLADDRYVDALYRHYAPTQEDVLELLRGDESLLSWGTQSAAELGRMLFERAAGPFASIAQLTIEDVLRARREKSPQAWFDALVKIAAPSWSIDRTRLPEGGNRLVRIMVLGVYDANDSIFGPLCSSLVTTRDPYRVTLLLTAVGAPYSAIQNFDDYQRRYEQARTRRPLHVLPDFQGDQDESKLAFALGSLFGMIRADGHYFYYQPRDGVRHDRQQLANGLENAVQALGPADGLVSDIMERVHAHISEIGTQQALGELDAYWDSEDGLTGRNADLIREFRVRVRDFAADLREISQFTQDNR